MPDTTCMLRHLAENRDPNGTAGLLVRLVVEGVTPPSKKNSERIVMIGGRPSVRASTQYEAATKAAIPQITDQWQAAFLAGKISPERIDFPVRMAVVFHVLYRPDSRNAPDLMNLLHAPADWLQPPKRNKRGEITTPGAGVIEDDRLIRSVDGSRTVYECDGCPDRKSGCNYQLVQRRKRNGVPRVRRNGKAMLDRVQVCERGGMEIELYTWEGGR